MERQLLTENAPPKKIFFGLKKNFAWVLVALLLVSQFYLFFRSQDIANTLNGMVRTYSHAMQENKQALSFEQQKDTLQFLSQRQEVSESLPLESLEGEELSISKLLAQEPQTFFLLFAENDCDACYKTYFEVLREVSVEKSTPKVVVLAQMANLRQVKNFVSQNAVRQAVFWLKKPLRLPISQLNVPYFFQLNAQYKTQFVWAWNKSYVPNLKSFF